jgi:hypothetical protein
MERKRATFFLALVLLAGCGAAGSTTTGGGGSNGTGGSMGQAGDMPGVDASMDDAAKDAVPDRIVTCEGRDGNSCSIMPGVQACQRCIQSCCCDPIAACRADAMCAAAIGVFNNCIQQGNMGVACLVEAVGTLPDAALFAAIADCVDMECGDLTCPL